MTCRRFVNIVCLLLLCHTITDGRNVRRLRRQIENKCTTPNNEAGTCINTKQCQSLTNLLEKDANNTETTTFLRKSQCAVENSTSKVCCPDQPTKMYRPSQPVPPEQNPLFSECGVYVGISPVIYGGKNATLGEWPWMVALYFRSATVPDLSIQCGASLISNRYVITAAHCVQNVSGDWQLSVARLGDLNVDPEVNDGATPIDVLVEKIIVHPQYSRQLLINDIALIRLQNTVIFSNYIRPICLLSGDQYKGDEYYANKTPTVIGWGITEFSNGNMWSALQETRLNTVNTQKCAQMYANRTLIDERVLCAEGGNQNDSCTGDSGGPLMFLEFNKNTTKTIAYLGGIVSYGNGCANPYFPGVYTRVAQFIDWINQVTGERY